MPRARNLVVEGVDVGKSRDDEHVRDRLGGFGRLLNKPKEARVDAVCLLGAVGAWAWRAHTVDPAAALVVERFVVPARLLAMLVRVRELLQEAVPDAVELIAEAPEEKRRVRRVLFHLVPKVLDDLLPLRECADGRLGGVAHVERRHQLQPVRVQRIEEHGMVSARRPAVDTDEVDSHRLD